MSSSSSAYAESGRMSEKESSMMDVPNEMSRISTDEATSDELGERSRDGLVGTAKGIVELQRGVVDASIATSSHASGSRLNKGLRFPREERREYDLDDIKVVMLGYKRRKDGEAYKAVYRCWGQEWSLPFINETEEDNMERYVPPKQMEVKECPDIRLSANKEKDLAEAQYLSVFSKLNQEKEGDLRADLEIGAEYELIFPDEKTPVSAAPPGCLSVYLARLDDCKSKWVDELHNVLWSYRTTPNARTGESPFTLCFGTEAVIPVEIGSPSMRIDFANDEFNDQKLIENLVLLETRRQEVAAKETRSKLQLAKQHDKKIQLRPLLKGDLVLRKNAVSRQEPSRKLDQSWEGPYIIKADYGNGSYKLQDTDGREVARTWNAINLQKYYA